MGLGDGDPLEMDREGKSQAKNPSSGYNGGKVGDACHSNARTAGVLPGRVNGDMSSRGTKEEKSKKSKAQRGLF